MREVVKVGALGASRGGMKSRGAQAFNIPTGKSSMRLFPRDLHRHVVCGSIEVVAWKRMLDDLGTERHTSEIVLQVTAG